MGKYVFAFKMITLAFGGFVPFNSEYERRKVPR